MYVNEGGNEHRSWRIWFSDRLLKSTVGCFRQTVFQSNQTRDQINAIVMSMFVLPVRRSNFTATNLKYIVSASLILFKHMEMYLFADFISQIK